MNVKDRLELLLKKIEKAALQSHRKAADVSLIAVSKQASVLQIQEAYDAGIRHFAESRLKEFLVKKELLPKDIVWHFIGTIQSNKAFAIAKNFSFVHSVSSLKSATLLSEAALKLQKKCSCFIELNISEEGFKQGFSVEAFLMDKGALLALKGLSIQGLMAMGPHTEDTQEIRAVFKELAIIQKTYLIDYSDLSMGMSSDFEIAIEEGSTHVRIGSLLFC